MTLLLLPHCHAAFSTIPSTLNWETRAPLASVCRSNPLQNAPPHTCYRFPRDPGYGSPRNPEVRTRRLDLWKVNVEYLFILLNELIIKSVYYLLCSSWMYRHTRTLLLQCSVFIQPLSMSHSKAYSVARLRAAALQIALRYGEQSSNTTNASIFNGW